MEDAKESGAFFQAGDITGGATLQDSAETRSGLVCG